MSRLVLALARLCIMPSSRLPFLPSRALNTEFHPLIPNSFRSFSSSNPTMTVSSTFVTGVVITCNLRSSSKAAGSLATFRSSNGMPFFERNSFVD
jgi:hypothetical protein